MRFCLTLVTIVSETSIILIELISHVTTIVELSASYGTLQIYCVFSKGSSYSNRAFFIFDISIS